MQFASKNSSILLPNSTLTELEASLFELTIVVVGDQPEVKESELWTDIHQGQKMKLFGWNCGFLKVVCSGNSYCYEF